MRSEQDAVLLNLPLLPRCVPYRKLEPPARLGVIEKLQLKVHADSCECVPVGAVSLPDRKATAQSGELRHALLDISSALRKVSSVNLSSTDDLPTLDEPIRSSFKVTTGCEPEDDGMGAVMFASCNCDCEVGHNDVFKYVLCRASSCPCECEAPECDRPDVKSRAIPTKSKLQAGTLPSVLKIVWFHINRWLLHQKSQDVCFKIPSIVGYLSSSCLSVYPPCLSHQGCVSCVAPLSAQCLEKH